MSLYRRVICELRDYIECFVIPAVAVVLPWWLAFRFFRAVAYVPFLYRHMTVPCVEGARYLQLLGDNEAAWQRAAKVIAMVDYADIFLLATRSKSYVSKYCDENISARLTEQQIIFTPHYGAGGWLYALLIKEKHSPAVLINLPPSSWRARYLIGRLRLAVLRRIGVLVMPPENVLAVRKIIREKKTLVVMPDIPINYDTANFQLCTDLGRLNVASGFFQLAEKRQIPLLTVTLAVNPHHGRREFDGEYWSDLTAIQYAEKFARQTVEAIKKYPPQWRMMVVAPQVILPKTSNDD